MMKISGEALAWSILENLSAGIVVIDAAKLDEFVFANRNAKAAFAAFRAKRKCVPAEVRAAALECLGRSATIGESRAIAIDAPTGRRFYVSALRLPEDPGLLLLSIGAARLRSEDRVKLLVAHYKLSKRQSQLAECVCEGLNNEQIAARLNLSTNTVKQYLSDIFGTLGVRSRTQLVALLEKDPSAS